MELVDLSSPFSGVLWRALLGCFLVSVFSIHDKWFLECLRSHVPLAARAGVAASETTSCSISVPKLSLPLPSCTGLLDSGTIKQLSYSWIGSNCGCIKSTLRNTADQHTQNQLSELELPFYMHLISSSCIASCFFLLVVLAQVVVWNS